VLWGSLASVGTAAAARANWRVRQALRFVSATVVALVAGVVVGACGDDDSTTEPTSTTAGSTAPTAAAATTTDAPPTSTSVPATTTSPPVPLEQPAVWPASGTVVATAEQAGADFVASVLGVPPRLGEFQAGDSRSGEIEVLAPAETAGAGSPIVRSVLLLRQLGPSNGWFVLAATNDHTAIASPESGATVSPGPVTVAGVGRGFEGLVVVEAFVAGTRTVLDQATAQGGATESSEPFEVVLDIGGAAPGDTVVVVARGGVGLETDPGEFSAIPLRVSDV
jgi:hypothetical protein